MSGEQEIPKAPGVYVDNGGDIWLRTADGRWYDNRGNTPSPMTDEAWEFLKGITPFTPLPTDSHITPIREYRISNEEIDFESHTYTLLEEAKLYVVDEGDRIETRVTLETEWKRVEKADAQDDTEDE